MGIKVAHVTDTVQNGMLIPGIMILFGLIGMLEGMTRKCGMLGGFFIGMFPIVGLIMIMNIPYKGEVLDEWLS